MVMLKKVQDLLKFKESTASKEDFAIRTLV
jgi:hypothetical protein